MHPGGDSIFSVPRLHLLFKQGGGYSYDELTFASSLVAALLDCCWTLLSQMPTGMPMGCTELLEWRSARVLLHCWTISVRLVHIIPWSFSFRFHSFSLVLVWNVGRGRPAVPIQFPFVTFDVLFYACLDPCPDACLDPCLDSYPLLVCLSRR